MLNSDRRKKFNTLADNTENHVVGVGGTGVVYRTSDHVRSKICSITDKPIPGLESEEVTLQYNSAGELLLNGKPFTLRYLQEMRRFRDALNEAAILDKISGIPHVVRLHGHYFGASNGYVVSVLEMARAPGESLHELPDLSLPDIGKIIGDVGVALICLANEGIVHRDIKPGNVHYQERGRPGTGITTLIDFGIAESINNWDEEAILSSPLILERGTPLYLTPDQANGNYLQPESDWFALGLMTYKLLRGQDAPTTPLELRKQKIPGEALFPLQLRQLRGYTNYQRDIIMGDLFGHGYSKRLAEAVGEALDAHPQQRRILHLIEVCRELATLRAPKWEYEVRPGFFPGSSTDSQYIVH